MKAARRLIELAQSEGVDRVFGNPGTTELPFMDELARVPEFHYFLGLHEGTAVSMADGYARATGRPSFLNLHIAAGLAHGLANMLNARRARTPMVVTVGQQDRRHLIHDPMLGGDLLALAQGAFKDAVEVNQVADLPTLMRRAFLLAQTPPTGPVMVSIPVDVLEEEWDDPLPARTDVRELGVAEGVDDLAEALLGAGAPAIVAGDGVGRSGAVENLVALAESLGATVFHEPMYDCVDFPATHPLSAGMLPPVDALIQEKLAKHDAVFLVGSHAFSAHYFTEATPIPDRTRILQLDSDRTELGRNYPAEIALQGGIGPTIRALTRLIGGALPRGRGPDRGREERARRPLPPELPAALERRADGRNGGRRGAGRGPARGHGHARGGDHHGPRGPPRLRGRSPGQLSPLRRRGPGLGPRRRDRREDGRAGPPGRLGRRRRDGDVHDPGPLVRCPLRRTARPRGDEQPRVRRLQAGHRLASSPTAATATSAWT